MRVYKDDDTDIQLQGISIKEKKDIKWSQGTLLKDKLSQRSENKDTHRKWKESTKNRFHTNLTDKKYTIRIFWRTRQSGVT